MIRRLLCIYYLGALLSHPDPVAVPQFLRRRQVLDGEEGGAEGGGVWRDLLQPESLGVLLKTNIDCLKSFLVARGLLRTRKLILFLAANQLQLRRAHMQVLGTRIRIHFVTLKRFNVLGNFDLFLIPWRQTFSSQHGFIPEVDVVGLQDDVGGAWPWICSVVRLGGGLRRGAQHLIHFCFPYLICLFAWTHSVLSLAIVFIELGHANVWWGILINFPVNMRIAGILGQTCISFEAVKCPIALLLFQLLLLLELP